MHPVLVTGSAGAIGLPVTEELLRRGHLVRGFDRRPSPAASESLVGDIADRDAVRRAVSGTSAVVHLAAVTDDAALETLAGPNLLGVHHVLDAAREHGVSRVALASSVQVGGRQPPDRPLSANDRQPSNMYALTKVWAEELGGMYGRVHGMTVISARIGWMVRNEREAKRLRELGWFHAYLSRGDAGRFFAAAIEATDAPSSVMYVVGPEGTSRYDLEPAKRLLGWEPRDVFPAGLPFAAER
jgi:uronate dehydrogenase